MKKFKLFVQCLGLICILNMLVGIQATAEQIKIKVEASNGDKIQESDIQKALDQARDDSENEYKITVPKGKYEINGLHIYSNTHLIIKGCTFKKQEPYRIGSMIQVGYPRKETKTYGVYGEFNTGYYWGKYLRGENIKIEGGTFDAGTSTENITTLCTFSHVKDITFKNVTFKYKPKEKTNKHMIEFGASKNVTLDSCNFIGNQNCGSAVQIESAIKGVAGSELMGKLDGTKTSKVIIKNSKFTNFEYAFGTNHGCDKDLYTGFVLKDNTFEQITKYAICVYNYQIKIEGNTIQKSSKSSFDSYILTAGSKNKVTKKKNVVK